MNAMSPAATRTRTMIAASRRGSFDGVASFELESEVERRAVEIGVPVVVIVLL